MVSTNARRERLSHCIHSTPGDLFEGSGQCSVQEVGIAWSVDHHSNKETRQMWSQRWTPLSWNRIGSSYLRCSAGKGHNQPKIESWFTFLPWWRNPWRSMGISLEGPSFLDFDPEAAVKKWVSSSKRPRGPFLQSWGYNAADIQNIDRIYPVFYFLAHTSLQLPSTNTSAHTVQTYRPFTLRNVYISKNGGICLVMVSKLSRLLATIVAPI